MTDEVAPQSSLMQRTLDLLASSSDTLESISQGAQVGFYWLRKFRAGEYADPSVNRVQRVYEYLTGQPLIVPTTADQDDGGSYGMSDYSK